MMVLRDDMASLWVSCSAWKKSASLDGSMKDFIFRLIGAKRRDTIIKIFFCDLLFTA